MNVDFSSLNKESFERLCKRLLLAEDNTIKTIDGSGGDEGIECFKGMLNGKVKIWQCKYFLDRLDKSSRKQQIENSLKRAREKHKVEEWVLCIPMEFSIAEEKWFENLQEKKENKKIKISHMNVHQLTNLVQQHKNIRDDFFRGEEKAQLNRMEKAINYLRRFGKEMTTQAYSEQISLFKLNLFNINAEKIIQILKDNAPFRAGLGFKKFRKVNDSFYKSFFYIPNGNAILKLNLDEEENPFKLSIPFSYPIEVWIKEIPISGTTILKTQITCFTSHDKSKAIFLRIIKGGVPSEIILEEINFNKRMKGLISNDKKFAPSTTTVELDPNFMQKVKGALGKKIDVEIRSNIIHSTKGGLSKTAFMQKALNLVKTIRKNGKVSEIIFFRAKQTSRVIPKKQVTLEVHNDGRIRVWFGRKVENREDMKIKLNDFIDTLA